MSLNFELKSLNLKDAYALPEAPVDTLTQTRWVSDIGI